MEKIASEMKLCELKQNDLSKAYEALHSQASSFLTFTVQWNELEEHFDTTRNLIECQSKELEERAKEIRDLGAKESELESLQCKIRLKEEKLNLTRNSVEECSKELELKKEQLEECCKKIRLKEEQLGLVENSIKKYNEEVKLKEKDLMMADQRLNDCTGQLVLKEEELYEVVMSIEECKMDLEFKGKQYDKIGELIKERSKELNLKENELEALQKSIKECSEEINSKKNLLNDQLNLMRNSVEECSKELESKKEQLDLVQKSFDECCKKIKLKEEQLGLVENSIKKYNGDLVMADQRLKDRNGQLLLKEGELCRVVKMIEERQMELELKERHDDSIKLLIQENSEELKLKENKYDEIGKLIKERLKELNLKENELEVAQKSIKECSEEIKSKQNILNLIEKSMDKKTKEFKELESKRKQKVDSMQAMLKKYSEDIELNENKIKAIQKSIAGQNKELEVKKNQLKSTQKLIEECGKKLKLKEEQLNSIHKTIVECSEECGKKLTDLDMKEQHLISLRKSIEERSHSLGMRERQFEERVKELESKEKQLLIQKSIQEGIKNKEFEGKIATLPSQVKIERPEFTPANNVIVSYTATKSCITSEGRNLQLLLNEHLKMHDMVRSDVLTVLETSSDPAKLVLDKMVGFYPSHSEEGDMEFDLSIIRRSCILLLEHLMRASPVVKPQVREEAMKLAVEWKAKMKVGNDNSLEVLGFLQLVATYGLGSAFSGDELCSLLDTIDQHRKPPELCHALGITHKTPDVELSSTHTQIKIEKSDNLPAENANDASYANLTLSCTPARSMQWFLNEKCNGPDLMSSGISADLEMSLDPAKLVLDELQRSFAQNWKKGDIGFGETVMKSYILRLEELVKVSPQISPQVKEEATKLALEWKVKIRVSTENSLEVFGFMQLLATYGLVSSFNLDEILELFEVVAHHKQALELCQNLGLADNIPDSRHSAPSPAFNFKPQEPVSKKRSTSDSPKHQAEEESRQKLPRTSVSAIRPDPLRVFTPPPSLLNLSPWQKN